MSRVVERAREIVKRLYERNLVSWDDMDREVVIAIQALNAEVQRLEALAQPDYRAVKTYHEGKPVYVAQPAQEPRPWVGLTDEEKQRIVNSCQTGTSREIFRAIEQALKEKNNA